MLSDTMAESGAGEAERQVQVRFVTKQAKYAVTDTPINVPLSLRRYALSEIVNHLLDSGTYLWCGPSGPRPLGARV